jgi:uncharacterized protein UPF0236
MVFARTPYIAQPPEVRLNPTTHAARTEHLLTSMTERMTTLTRTLSSWMQEQPHTLAELEQQVLRLLKEVGASLVAGLAQLAAPAEPSASIECACGHLATYQRERKAQVTTLLGSISFERSYYLCAECGVGQHPLDAQLQVCAGSRSQALDELLALLGATQDSFVQAAEVLERLSLVHVCANSVRQATEQLGARLLEYQAQERSKPDANPAPRLRATAQASPLYITMDGVLAHLHERGWSEIKVGCCYHTQTRADRKRGERLEIRAQSPSYVSALEEAQRFGWRLWQEALRRGVLSSEEVVVLGDGAHWIWNIAEKHFPRAIQIVDWYHASEYLWNAASAIWGEASGERAEWAHTQLDKLWESKVSEVLLELEQWRERGEAVEAARSYYSEHQKRMDYASYRARGFQIGSGSAESACKQLVSARLKQAGMIWDADGAEAVATVRAWLKSERWGEAIALREVRRRSYRRKQPGRAEEASQDKRQGAKQQASGMVEQAGKARRHELSADVLAHVQAELSQQRGKNGWGRAWSIERQRGLAARREQETSARAA